MPSSRAMLPRLSRSATLCTVAARRVSALHSASVILSAAKDPYVAAATDSVADPSSCLLRMTRRGSKGLLALVLAAVLTAFAAASVALADAAPVELVLTYMPNVSNTGTPAASGIAELVMSEGEVRVSAANLPHLDGDSRYVAWVVNTHTNQFQRLGAFNADPDAKTVKFENVLPDAIPNKQWDLLLVTVEPSAEPDHPGAKHSLAGTFPRADSDPPPALLPNTGGAPDPDVRPASGRPEWLPEAGLVALGSLFGFGAGYGLGSKKR